MSEKTESGNDLFSSLGKWMNFAHECSETIIESALEQLSRPYKEIDTTLGSLSSLTKSLLNSDPGCMHKVIDNQLDLMSSQLELMEATFERVAGKKVDPVIRPSVNDRRFIDDEWNENPFFDFVKQSYLLNSQALKNLVECLNLSETDKERVDFYTRQISSALSPSNFPISNPEIVRRFNESNGESLYKGFEQLLEDRKKSGNLLNVCMSKSDCFELGKNIAHTPGKVVYENDLIQLIQYSPSQSKVHQVPLLFTPSWVNKFYIYDLREKNSMVKWALDQGLSVFMISWVNPDESYRYLNFDDYLQRGVLSAVNEVKAITGSESVNCVGYCLGGSLLATATAYLAKKGDNSISSATYLATSFDFKDPGDMRVVLDESVIDGLNQTLDENGYLDGRTLAVTFSMLRENELYWNYYIQNYLKGERPSGFDILHWNSDSTNVPANTHKFVLDMVRYNKLIQPDALRVLGETIDLKQINIPVYILATEKDHIAKWQSCFPAIEAHGGPSRFVLAGSGHIAGVVNPPSGNKYHYYVNTNVSDDPENWLDGAFKHEGSWWPDWYNWMSQYAGDKIEATAIDIARVLEDAPGRYVKKRLDDISQPKKLLQLPPPPDQQAA